MAAKRITSSAINWAALAERVPPAQKPNLMAFKVKSDGYMRRVAANPEQPPSLDWNFYKQHVSVPGMVAEFQKQYESLKVPYPADNYTSKIDEQDRQAKAEVESFKKQSNQRIVEYENEITKLRAQLPYDQMTMEDYRDAFPEDALDPINRPTFWPHTPEEQLGYKSKDHVEGSSH